MLFAISLSPYGSACMRNDYAIPDEIANLIKVLGSI
jgi:hypothetical protein